MQQLRKYTICCILLAVQVQVVLCGNPNPRIFSARSVYANSDLRLQGASLMDTKFKVIFSEPIDATTFDKSDINVIVNTDISVDQAPVVKIKSLMKTSDMHWEFDLEDSRDTVPNPSIAVTHVSFQMEEGTVLSQSGESSHESNMHSIHYASEFVFTSVQKTAPEGTMSIVWDLRTSRDSHVIGHHPMPFKVCLGDDGCVGNELRSEALLAGDHMIFKVEHIRPGQRYCLVGNADENNVIIADVYGNYIDTANLPDMCHDVPDDPCAFTWSLWSDCTYACKPIEGDEDSNTRTRHQVFAVPEECNQIPESQSKPCDITFTQPCMGRIFGGETGSECTCATSNDPVDIAKNTYLTSSGCECGGDCQEKGTCCQSYYKNCVENAAALPELKYKYFPCWQPQTCNPNDTKPSCTSTRRGTSDFSGSCDGRQYSYYCMCSLERFKCFYYSYADQCCGGEDNYRASCGFPKTT